MAPGRSLGYPGRPTGNFSILFRIVHLFLIIFSLIFPIFSNSISGSSSSIISSSSSSTVLVIVLLSCMERNCHLRNCTRQFFWLIFDIFEARGGPVGLKLDEIEAANSFPMLPMSRNGLKWSETNREKSEKQKRSRNGQRNEPSSSRYHRSARNFATILMVLSVLRITNLKISNFSWSEPEIINMIICVRIIGLIPCKNLYFLVVVIVVVEQIENIENFRTDLGCFGGALGTVWGRDVFGTVSDRLWKIENLRVQNWKIDLDMTSNTPKDQ